VSLRVEVVEALDQVEPEAWDALNPDNDPFLRHTFLSGLERHDCLGQAYGWYPCHVLIREPGGRLVGGMPMYVKTNSYGEFVFDWSWASAYERYGQRYYPKLVIGIPYTPITGRRLLVLPDCDPAPIKDRLIDTALELTRTRGYSGVHWLFTDSDDTAHLKAHGLMLRLGCQFHWSNPGYADFDDFLARFSSRKRKKVRRERRRVDEQDLALTTLHGDQVSDALWETFHRFYVDTFDRKSGIPTLSLAFFRELGRAMGRQLVLVLAEQAGRPVAGAINLRSDDSLFGRYWGCEREFDSLHFEACYYRGIDYCISEGLTCFQPGAQGEHKISRGFLPTRTWSAHAIMDPQFRDAVADFCRREEMMMEGHCRELGELSPFRRSEDTEG
jgi:hypothetical protein